MLVLLNSHVVLDYVSIMAFYKTTLMSTKIGSEEFVAHDKKRYGFSHKSLHISAMDLSGQMPLKCVTSQINRFIRKEFIK